VLSDIKEGDWNLGTSTISDYRPQLLSRADYFAGGSLLTGCNYSSSSYRFGFNGMPKDDEINGATGTSYDFGARLYDPRVGRWLSLDPLQSQYPNLSAYSFAANSPIFLSDFDGRVIRDARGNIVYTKGAIDPVTYTTRTGETVREVYVYIYSNDGSKHEAIIRTVTSGEIPGLNQSYDCHGLTKTDGLLFVNSGDPMEGLLSGDGQGPENQFKDLSCREVGDIAVFRGEHPGDGSSDRVIHSAIYKGEGVFRSKNGVMAEGDFSLGDLEGFYGDDVSYAHPVTDRTLGTLSGGAGASGLAQYAEADVRSALASDKRRASSRTNESWDAHKRKDSS